MANIQRLEVVAARLGIGVSKFYDQFMHHGDGRDVIPGTDIPRLRPVRLGAKAIGFLSDETDALIDALRRRRDTTPPRPEPEHLRVGRDAYWKRERRKRAKERGEQPGAKRGASSKSEEARA